MTVAIRLSSKPNGFDGAVPMLTAHLSLIRGDRLVSSHKKG
jgi:hypothetical protein